MHITDQDDVDARSARTPGVDSARPIASIQPGGLLLVMSDDWQIEGASANCADFLGCEPADLIGRAASDFLADEAIHALRNRLALLRDPAGIERLFAHRLLGDEVRFDIAIHCCDRHVIVEAEPTHAKPYGDATGTLRGMVARLDQASDRASFLAEGTRQLRALTGFDRVMTVQFNEDGSSVVVGEHARGGIGSLLGTKWPQTPIAQDERELLLHAPLHHCADVDAAPIDVLGGGDFARLDLGCAVLRPIAPAYAEACRAIGVRASMMVALVVDGRLWGLIACHHSHPRSPSFERRSIVELFAQLFAMRLEIFQLKSAPASRG